MIFPEDALTDDKFLMGRLRLLQPAKGYRAATDPVLLAAATAGLAAPAAAAPIKKPRRDGVA